MLRFVSGNQSKAQSLFDVTVRRVLALSSPTLIAECSGTENLGQFAWIAATGWSWRRIWLKVGFVTVFRGVLLMIAPLAIWQASADGVEALNVPNTGTAGFTRLSPEQTGISFINQLADARAATNRNLLSGSGVAAGDVNGDGWCDLYFCALDNSNALYLNRGNWRFEEAAEKAGVACANWDCTGATFADVDGDGDLDLLVNTMNSGTHLFINDGKGHFQDRTPESGLSSSHAATSMALADIDGDGDLDLYVAHFRPNTIRDRPQTKFEIEYANNHPVVTHVDGRPATAADLTNRFAISPETGQVEEYAEEDALYENDGNGHFTLIPFTGGRFLDENGKPLTSAPRDWGLSVQFRDFTGDGAPDIYVCNDYFTPDRIWINDGKGSFRALPPEALRHTSLSSMGVDFADINHDGFVDFFVVDMLSQGHSKRQVQVGDLAPFISRAGEIFNRPQIPQNTLQLNRGDSTFCEIGMFSGVEGSGWSWCPVFLDVDLDGWEDILVSNGHRRDFQDADAAAQIRQALSEGKVSFEEPAKIMDLFPILKVPKAAFRNSGNLTFKDVSTQWRFHEEEISHGMALADLDNDGDLDVVINNLLSPAGIYRNEANAPRILVRCRGKDKNTSAVGARVSLIGEKFTQTQEIISGGRYLSGGGMERTFGTAGQKKMELNVRFRNGETKTITNIAPNNLYLIERAP
jgi:hypothetical protein